MDAEELIRPGLAAMEGYAAIEPIEVLEERVGKRIVKLDGNENPYACSPKVYQALADYSYYHIYPDPSQGVLRQALEQYTGLAREHIVCGNGSDELIDLVLRLFLRHGDEVINCPPTFGMYPFCTGVCGGELVDVPRKEDFGIDVPAIREALSGKTKVILVASPNNPTGNTVSEREVMELVDMGRIVVVDEAYFEFSNMTVGEFVPQHQNLVVLRTFSKWAGLAGLRVGYGICPTEIARYLLKLKPPYNVNVAAEAAVLASLADLDYLRANIAKITAERERLFAKLNELEWLRPYPSEANFILCSIRSRSSDSGESPARRVWRRLSAAGIFVRYYNSPGLEDCLRISVGRPEDTDVLIEALKGMG